jgi:hypothetical protein
MRNNHTAVSMLSLMFCSKKSKDYDGEECDPQQYHPITSKKRKSSAHLHKSAVYFLQSFSALVQIVS